MDFEKWYAELKNDFGSDLEFVAYLSDADPKALLRMGFDAVIEKSVQNASADIFYPLRAPQPQQYEDWIRRYKNRIRELQRRISSDREMLRRIANLLNLTAKYQNIDTTFKKVLEEEYSNVMRRTCGA